MGMKSGKVLKIARKVTRRAAKPKAPAPKAIAKSRQR
jgi:hypothetical protein